jgi:hypothetical protein
MFHRKPTDIFGIAPNQFLPLLPVGAKVSLPLLNSRLELHGTWHISKNRHEISQSIVADNYPHFLT